MNNEEENKSQTVDICPLGKGKRMLAFLADFFINFILTFVLFNAAAMPLTNLAFGATARQARSDSAARAQFDILYGNKLMFYETDDDKYYYTKDVEITLNSYLSYYGLNDEDVIEGHPQYGHKAENEVLLHFYKDIRNKYDTYKTSLTNFDKDHGYFVITDDSIALNATIKNEIRLSFISPSDMSESGKKALGYLQDYFINAYADLFNDILKNDLTYNAISYLSQKKIVDESENNFQIQLIVAAATSYFISSLVIYLVVPLHSKDNKTFAMMMMRIERIGTNNLFFIRKSESALLFVYSLVFNLPLLFFMPMTQVDFSYLFNITPLLSMLTIGFISWVISFFMIIFSSFNQTLSDKLSRSVLISESDLDAIYRAKGYNV